MFSLLQLVNNVLCVDNFDPDTMNIPELIEHKKLIATFPNESNDAFKKLCTNLACDLHSFESNDSSPNNFQNFSSDVYEKMNIAETELTRLQAMSAEKLMKVLGKYADQNPENVDPEDVIKDLNVILNEIYNGLTAFATKILEAKKEYVEKINRNAFVTEETKEIAKTIISTTEKQFGYIKKLHQLHEKGMGKAAKMHFKGGKKMSLTKVLIIVGLVLVGVVILAVIGYYASKPKTSNETHSSTV